MNIIVFVVIILSINYSIPDAAHADYGIRSIDIECNKSDNILIIQPYIMWNEALENFLEIYKSGISNEHDILTRIFDESFYETNFHHQCTLQNFTYGIDIIGKTMKVTRNGEKLFQKELDYIWFAHGELYELQFDKSGSPIECCGNDVGTANPYFNCGPLSNSSTTNCTDVNSNRD